MSALTIKLPEYAFHLDVFCAGTKENASLTKQLDHVNELVRIQVRQVPDKFRGLAWKIDASLVNALFCPLESGFTTIESILPHLNLGLNAVRNGLAKTLPDAEEFAAFLQDFIRFFGKYPESTIESN